ncbi:MAG: PEP-CTERM system TPR-repeat protein PrsT [Gammaproteobacteria bacterium]|nr:PEP-CTERM system TPR-repeat protein PrsT [Gammaproteobacteria bacterium]
MMGRFQGMEKGVLGVGMVVLSLLLSSCGMLGQDPKKLAAEYMSQGRYRAAAIEFKNILQKEPENFEARRSLGELYIKFGDAKAAEKELGRASKAKPDDVALKLKYVRALLMDERPDDAIKVLDGVNATGDDQLDLMIVQGDAYLEKQEVDKARGFYEQVLDKKSDDIQARVGLARAMAMAEKFQEAGDNVDQVLKLDPQNIDAWLLKANIAFVQQKYDQALEAYTAAWGKGEDLNTLRMIQSRFGMVTALLSLGKEDEAVPIIDELRNRIPNHPLPHFWRAQVYYHNGKYADARDELLQVLRVAPDHDPSNLLLGSTYYSLGENAQAEHYLQTYVSRNRDDVRARKLLAAVRLRLKTPDLAFEALAPVMADAKDDPQLMALAGSAALRKGDLDQGVRYLKGALLSAPDDASVRAELGLAYMAQGENQLAIQALQVPDDGSSESARIRTKYLLIMAYVRQKDFKRAHGEVQKMLDDKVDPKLAYNLEGLVYWEEGQLGDAATAFSKVIELDPNNQIALSNFARLQSQRGRLAESSDLYSRVLAIDPKNVEAFMAQATISMKQQNEKQALSWLKKAIDANDKAIEPRLVLARYDLQNKDLSGAKELYSQVNAIAPDSTAALRLGAELAQASDNPRDAIRLIRRLLKDNPKDTDALVRLAILLLAENKVEEARVNLRTALDADKNLVVARELLARIAMKNGDEDTAREYVAAIRKQTGNDTVADILEGDLASQGGDQAKAIQLYRKILARHPDNRIAMLRIYFIRKQSSDKEAKAELEDWLKHNPKDLQIRMVLASEYMAAVDYKRAAKHYEEVLAQDKDKVIALNNLAWLYDQQGDPRALDTAKRAYEAKQSDGAIIDTYAWMLVNHDQVDEGVRLLSRAHDLSPDNTEIRYHLAVALIKNGMAERARTLLEKMRASPNDSFHAKQVDELLKGAK